MDEAKNEDFKVQREKLVQNIRRQTRQSQFNKRRNFSLQNHSIQLQLGSIDQTSATNNLRFLVVDEQRRQEIQNFIKAKYFPEMFPALVSLLYSQDILQIHHGMIGIRKILSLNDTPPIHLVFQHQILPLIIKFIKQTIYPHLRLESTWIVSNIATGGTEQVTALLQHNIIPILVSLLKQSKFGISDQAIWAVGNLAGDSPSVRDKIIDQGGIESVIHFINNTSNRNNLVQAAWALSNLCRGNPLPSYEKIYKSVPVLCKIIKLNILDDENLSDCLWALSYSIQGPKQKINMFLQNQILKKIIQSSKSHLLSIASPALRILGTISTGNQLQTQELLNENVLQTFEQLLDSKKQLVRRQVCWILSNIAAGTRNQVDELLNRQNMIDKILSLFEMDSSEVKRQICYIFGNMVYLGERRRVKNLLINKQILRYYGQCILQRNNTKLIDTCLDILPMLFDFGQRVKTNIDQPNFAVLSFLNYPGVTEGFQQLQAFEMENIYQKALKIYQKYIQKDPFVNENDNMIPQV